MRGLTGWSKPGWIPLLVATVGTLCVATVGYATFLGDGSVRATKFDPVLVVNASGRRLFLTGTVECTQGENVQLHLTISQRLIGAVAEGNWKGVCTGNQQLWETEAVTRAGANFEPEAAQAGGSGVTLSQGKSTDAIQWLDGVVLVKNSASE